MGRFYLLEVSPNLETIQAWRLVSGKGRITATENSKIQYRFVRQVVDIGFNLPVLVCRGVCETGIKAGKTVLDVNRRVVG